MVLVLQGLTEKLTGSNNIPSLQKELRDHVRHRGGLCDKEVSFPPSLRPIKLSQSLYLIQE